MPSPAIYKLLRSGALVDLLAPDWTLLDVGRDIIGPLGRLARFDGQLCARGEAEAAYSVLQHSILGARALIAEGAAPEVALAFLLHDAHEPILGDQTTPVVRAIDARAGTNGRVAAALDDLKADWDKAVRRAFALDGDWTDNVRRAVAAMDRRMLIAGFIALGFCSSGRLRLLVGDAAAAEPPQLEPHDFAPMPAAAAEVYFLRLVDAWHPLGPSWQSVAAARRLAAAGAARAEGGR